jgi:hypothetical protein
MTDRNRIIEKENEDPSKKKVSYEKLLEKA